MKRRVSVATAAFAGEFEVDDFPGRKPLPGEMASGPGHYRLVWRKPRRGRPSKVGTGAQQIRELGDAYPGGHGHKYWIHWLNTSETTYFRALRLL